MSSQPRRDKYSETDELKIQVNALVALLIRKGIITRKDLEDEIFKHRPDKVAFVLDEKSKLKIHSVKSEKAVKLLPKGITLRNRHLVFNDPKSADILCSECIEQKTIDLGVEGIMDSCGLPDTIQTHYSSFSKAQLKSVNPVCWMPYIAESLLIGIKEHLIESEQIPELFLKTVQRIEIAMEQHIQPEGIHNIIDCTLLTENRSETDEDVCEDILGAPKSEDKDHYKWYG